MDDKRVGFYKKFFVSRVDGTSALWKKHENCHYFVLDIDCGLEYPNLAKDLRNMIE